MLGKKDFLFLFFFTFVFIAFSWFLNPSFFQSRFDERLISDYLRSQDIEDREDKIKDRLFISDDKIYFASGVLYARGEPPTKFNFQHPPLLKYLFGWSTILFGSPFPIQIFFSLAFIFLVYFLAFLVFKNRLVAFLAVCFLFLDPVFWETSHLTLLDVGQVVFALAFLILFFFYPKRIFLQGVFLGFLFASKFWSVSFLYFAFLVFYIIWFFKDKSFVKSLPILIFVSFLVFSSFYINYFLSGNSLFDFLFLQARTVKFMLTHNNTNNFGNLFLLFISGHYLSWWDGGIWVKSQFWNPIWPISFLASIFLAFKLSKNKKAWFIFIFPAFYFLVNLTNTAFTRYILFVLPFLYISLAYGISLLVNSKVGKRAGELKSRSC